MLVCLPREQHCEVADLYVDDSSNTILVAGRAAIMFSSTKVRTANLLKKVQTLPDLIQ